jgi:hypothetical protein
VQENCAATHTPFATSDIGVASYAKKFLGPNVIFMRDIYGNNALHLCVMRSLTGMYEHVLKRAEGLLRNELKMAYGEKLEELRSGGSRRGKGGGEGRGGVGGDDGYKDSHQSHSHTISHNNLHNHNNSHNNNNSNSHTNTHTHSHTHTHTHRPASNKDQLQDIIDHQITQGCVVDLRKVDVKVELGEGYGHVPKETDLFMPLESQYHAWLQASTKAKIDERFTLCLNEDCHSPLTLAADMVRSHTVMLLPLLTTLTSFLLLLLYYHCHYRYHYHDHGHYLHIHYPTIMIATVR